MCGACQVDAGILSACRELIATHLHEYDLGTFHQFPPFALAGVLALASRHPDSYVRGRIVASYVRERDRAAAAAAALLPLVAHKVRAGARRAALVGACSSCN